MVDATAMKSLVFAAIIARQENKTLSVTDETPLIGGESRLDSMKLVELCLVLEDKASELGFEFDWTSDTAMSKSRSMFKTAGSLAGEFIHQMTAQMGAQTKAKS